MSGRTAATARSDPAAPSHPRKPLMQFMVIERFRDRDARAVVEARIDESNP
jgi:hypothetical protein